MKFKHCFLQHILIYVIFKCHLSNEYEYAEIEKRKKQATNIDIESFNMKEMNKEKFVANISTSFSYIDLERYREKRKVLGIRFYLWSKLSIPFYIDKNLNRNAIVKALREIEKETCVRFYEVNRVHKWMSGIRYISGNYCCSLLGKQLIRGFQKITLSKKCETVGSVQHETLHALGIDHEHNRIDRNKYLFVLSKNIKRSDMEDFDTPTTLHSNTLGLPYDYGSIMHYSMFAFSKNEEPTLVPKQMLYNYTIGHSEKLSFIDIKTINMLYCRNKCTKKLVCFHGSYEDPNDCRRCKCVPGFVGNNCYYFTKNLPSCKKSMHVAQKFPQEIADYGKKNCYYLLTTRKDAKILLKVVYTKIYPFYREPCSPEDSLEIKYLEDKTVTGARFCGAKRNVVFYSHSNTVIIYFKSTDSRNKFKLMFKK